MRKWRMTVVLLMIQESRMREEKINKQSSRQSMTTFTKFKASLGGTVIFDPNGQITINCVCGCCFHQKKVLDTKEAYRKHLKAQQKSEEHPRSRGHGMDSEEAKGAMALMFPTMRVRPRAHVYFIFYLSSHSLL